MIRVNFCRTHTTWCDTEIKIQTHVKIDAWWWNINDSLTCHITQNQRLNNVLFYVFSSSLLVLLSEESWRPPSSSPWCPLIADSGLSGNKVQAEPSYWGLLPQVLSECWDGPPKEEIFSDVSEHLKNVLFTLVTSLMSWILMSRRIIRRKTGFITELDVLGCRLILSACTTSAPVWSVSYRYRTTAEKIYWSFKFMLIRGKYWACVI